MSKYKIEFTISSASKVYPKGVFYKEVRLICSKDKLKLSLRLHNGCSPKNKSYFSLNTV